jgi:hypothetical protein
VATIYFSGFSYGFKQAIGVVSDEYTHVKALGGKTQEELDFLAALDILHHLEESEASGEVHLVSSAPYVEAFLRRTRDPRKQDCQKVAKKARRIYQSLLRGQQLSLSFSTVPFKENPAYQAAKQVALTHTKPMQKGNDDNLSPVAQG